MDLAKEVFTAPFEVPWGNCCLLIAATLADG